MAITMQAAEVKKVTVVGAGVMGRSIALVFACAEIKAALVDVNEAALTKALDITKQNLKTLIKAGKISENAKIILDRIHPSTDLEAAAKDCDFAIEAVPETPEVKKRVFSALDEACRPDVIIASNTSTLDIFGIADIKRKDKLVAAHWFNPPHIMPLVEIAPGPQTSPETLAFTAELLERVGKKTVVMKKFAPGFIVNRIQQFITLVVLELMRSDCASIEDIDRAVKMSLGIRLPVLGVVQALDFMGLNLIYDVMKSAGAQPHPLIEEKVQAGHIGPAASKGFYDYGSMTEEEILAKRDELFLKLLDNFRQLGIFDTVI